MLILIRNFIVLGFLLTMGGLRAQFDTNYVFKTKTKFAVYPLFEAANSEVYYHYKNANNNTYFDYKSRAYVSVGVGASFYRLGFSLSFELPYSSISALKNQTAFNFKGGYSYRKLYGELIARIYKGMEENILYPNQNEYLTKIRKDVNYTQYGLGVYYFTADKFNYDANFKNYNVQKKSAISPTFYGGINYAALKGKLRISGTSTKQPQYMTKLEERSIRLLPGISFSIVYKNMYIAAMACGGISINRNHVELEETENNYWSNTPTLLANVICGYNSNNYFASVAISVDNGRSRYESLYFGGLHKLIQIKVGKKLNLNYLGKIGKYL